MILLIAWIVAVGIAVLTLGIIGFGLVGQLRRLRRAVELAQTGPLTRASDLLGDLPNRASVARHGA